MNFFKDAKKKINAMKHYRIEKGLSGNLIKINIFKKSLLKLTVFILRKILIFSFQFKNPVIRNY